MSNLIFKNRYIIVELEKSSIVWYKVFSVIKYKEFSQADNETKKEILLALDIIEKEMLEKLNPTKINIASFGNYLPHLHFHIMSRHKDDSHFPEPMWGTKQRDGVCYIEDITKFNIELSKKLEVLNG